MNLETYRSLLDLAFPLFSFVLLSLFLFLPFLIVLATVIVSQFHSLNALEASHPVPRPNSREGSVIHRMRFPEAQV